jgi:hypothetical protein
MRSYSVYLVYKNWRISVEKSYLFSNYYWFHYLFTKKSTFVDTKLLIDGMSKPSTSIDQHSIRSNKSESTQSWPQEKLKTTETKQKKKHKHKHKQKRKRRTETEKNQTNTNRNRNGEQKQKRIKQTETETESRKQLKLKISIWIFCWPLCGQHLTPSRPDPDALSFKKNWFYFSYEKLLSYILNIIQLEKSIEL